MIQAIAGNDLRIGQLVAIGKNGKAYPVLFSEKLYKETYIHVVLENCQKDEISFLV